MSTTNRFRDSVRIVGRSGPTSRCSTVASVRRIAMAGQQDEREQPGDRGRRKGHQVLGAREEVEERGPRQTAHHDAQGEARHDPGVERLQGAEVQQEPGLAHDEDEADRDHDRDQHDQRERHPLRPGLVQQEPGHGEGGGPRRRAPSSRRRPVGGAGRPWPASGSTSHPRTRHRCRSPGAARGRTPTGRWRWPGWRSTPA
jgi:hypothetical protein